MLRISRTALAVIAGAAAAGLAAAGAVAMAWVPGPTVTMMSLPSTRVW